MFVFDGLINRRFLLRKIKDVVNIVELPQGSYFGIIYKIENLCNGKVYIGQTTKQKGFYGRYPYGNVVSQSSNSYLKSSIQKYGMENFKIYECIDVGYDREDLNNKEIFWIKFYQATNPEHGYNRHSGGSLDFNLPEESRQSMIRAKKSKPSWNRGKSWSEETRRKIKENHANFARGNHPEAKPVRCITTGKEFACLSDGAEYYRCDLSYTSKCCRGLAKHSGRLEDGTQLEWEFITPSNNENKQIK